MHSNIVWQRTAGNTKGRYLEKTDCHQKSGGHDTVKPDKKRDDDEKGAEKNSVIYEV